MQSIVDSVAHKARSLLGQEFEGEIRAHTISYTENLGRQRKAALAGDGKAVRKIQRTILRSYSAKLVCLVRALDEKDGLTAPYVEATAGALNPWNDSGEPVTAWAEPKPLGQGWRIICSFGPRRKALQTLCADILEARYGLEEVDYLRRGRGTESASDRINKLVEESGIRYFVTADIEDFFGSVQQKSIAGITGLPEAVVNNCLFIGPQVSLTLIGSLPDSVTLEAFDGAVRQGLPQGSRASQLIASLLLGPAMRSLAPADRIIVYGDDSAIGVKCEKEAEALALDLLGSFETHPAGPFRVKFNVGDVEKGFDFLKYHHKRDWVTGKVRRRPSNKCYRRYVGKVAAKVLAEGEELIADYRGRWTTSFRRWERNELSEILLDITTMEAMAAGKKPDK